ncbi:uncharacterized protein LOC127842251 isoform X1 [Dreissena polymorpha]|uniref:Mab-21-like HhH/H2TH-like domain-containing protein n=1 Tax=Dreissena polymorpha TaxID=45954 RepID=A0A9D4IY89_DREPO|nr:uncharacterized protein LOC127842251 isoform X1 [Dreissena polymorpha]KAH3788688.1 hypothetical protein DPMN_166835 [Dreissena polymorpha]
MADGGVRHYTEWTPRLINRSRFEYEDESKQTSSIMDILGYGPDIRKKRKEIYKEWDELQVYHGEIILITAGSKAEGLTCAVESDRDSILVMPNAVCLEDGVDKSIIPGHMNLFEMNIQSCNAGYCRLLLTRLGPSGHPSITDSLCGDGYGRRLMSSKRFIDHFADHWRSHSEGVNNLARAGPSLPQSYGPFHIDVVSAIRCNCPGILQKWASRTRHWPSPNIVEKVIAMGAFVTPIGFKGSAHNHVEWRICFNTAETELLNNLNDTQVKIYIILKMIVNDVLKPKFKEITSYTLKNIVLWLAENNPQEWFHSGSLFHFLFEGLDRLRTALSDKQLPYYMIPERNLMAERELDVEQQGMWVRSITDMINEGPRIIMKLEKIGHAIECHPEPLLWYSRMRTELEMLYLESNNRLLRTSDNNGQVDENDPIVKAIDKRISEIFREVLLRMQLEGSSVNDVNKLFPMMLS